jgi:hypothetical protein
VGSSGSKSRKPRHPLPKVGSPANRAYELRERRKEVFGGTPTVIWAVVVLLVIVSFVIVTA